MPKYESELIDLALSLHKVEVDHSGKRNLEKATIEELRQSALK